MWTCPKCERSFRVTNQSHVCVKVDPWSLFERGSDEVLLAFDSLASAVLAWEPCTVSATEKAAVFTSDRAWLIVRPMKSAIDAKFYADREIESPHIHVIRPWNKTKFAHHVRLQSEHQLTGPVLDLLRGAHARSLD